jgi:hypothetical protein
MASSYSAEKEPHRKLRLEAKDYLGSLGFYVSESPYHLVLEGAMSDRISWIDDPTAFDIRFEPDGVAVHRDDKDILFKWEIKTHKSRKGDDMCIEAYQLMKLAMAAQRGARCLYIYRNDNTGDEAGFWVQDTPWIELFMIPERFEGEEGDWYKKLCYDEMKGVLNIGDIRRNVKSQGSGYPFYIIRHWVVEGLPHWKDLIKRELIERAGWNFLNSAAERKGNEIKA